MAVGSDPGQVSLKQAHIGEANELIDEVARSEVNEMGDAMATASGDGEASEANDAEAAAPAARAPRCRGSKGQKSGDRRRMRDNAKKGGE